MNLKFLAAAGLAALLLAGCETTYGDMDWGGGVAAMPVSSDTYRISARGNDMTSALTIQDYALLKAAETTLAAGKTHFAIISGADATTRSTYHTPGTFNTNFYGTYAMTTYNPGVSYNVVRPGEDLLIRVFNHRGGTVPQNSFNAQEVFDAINPRVKRTEEK